MFKTVSKRARPAFNPDDYESISVSKGFSFFISTVILSFIIATGFLLGIWFIAYCATFNANPELINFGLSLEHFLENYASRMGVAFVFYVPFGLIATGMTYYPIKHLNIWIFKMLNWNGKSKKDRLQFWQWLIFQGVFTLNMLVVYGIFSFAVRRIIAPIFVSAEERQVFIYSFQALFNNWVLYPGRWIMLISIVSAMIIGARFNSMRDQDLAEPEESEEEVV